MSRNLPRTVEQFMACACAMEIEASERYAELAELMGTHNNREVAELFAKLARIEGKHRDQIMIQMGWTTPPAARLFCWEAPEGPETATNSPSSTVSEMRSSARVSTRSVR